MATWTSVVKRVAQRGGAATKNVQKGRKEASARAKGARGECSVELCLGSEAQVDWYEAEAELGGKE